MAENFWSPHIFLNHFPKEFHNPCSPCSTPINRSNPTPYNIGYFSLALNLSLQFRLMGFPNHKWILPDNPPL